jgi:hypothetical protein
MFGFLCLYVWSTSWISMIESEMCVRACARMSHQTHLHTRMNTTHREQVHTRMNLSLQCCVRIRTNAYTYGTVDNRMPPRTVQLCRVVRFRAATHLRNKNRTSRQTCRACKAKLQSWKKCAGCVFFKTASCPEMSGHAHMVIWKRLWPTHQTGRWPP